MENSTKISGNAASMPQRPPRAKKRVIDYSKAGPAEKRLRFGGHNNQNGGGGGPKSNRPIFPNQNNVNQKSNVVDAPKADEANINDKSNKDNNNSSLTNTNTADQAQVPVQAQNQGFSRRNINGGGRTDKNRASRGGGGGGQNSGGVGNNSVRSDDFFIAQRLRSISGPTHELPPFDEVVQETKFSLRNRLYIGNLTNDITEEELRVMFKPYGEITEIFANLEKNFAFLKVDHRINAEKAKRALDGSLRKGRQLRVRFAPNSTILRVSNLTQFVSNELLYKSFEIFGPIEKATITVDDRGKHMGEATVEFAKKSSASACLRWCHEKCFFLTASLRPCLVEPIEINDDTDGLPEKALNKKLQEFNQERSVGPRFAYLNSFEHEYGSRWKQLHDLFKTKQDALKRELKMEEEKLQAQMEYARCEQETELLRQELRKRESENERMKMECELREKQAKGIFQREEEAMRHYQTEIQNLIIRQEKDMHRRQLMNTLFIEGQQLNSMLDQQESYESFERFGGGNGNGYGTNNNNNNVGANNQQQDGFAHFEFGVNNNNQGGNMANSTWKKCRQ